MIKVNIIWLFLCLITSTVGWMDERPVLESIDGNLIISSAKDKNITIKILGNGYFTVDDIDILNTAISAKSAARLVESWRNGYLQELMQKVNHLSELVEGNHGLMTRLNIMETGFRPSTNGFIRPNSSSQIKPSDDLTASAIRGLQVRVRRLESRIRTVVTKLRYNQCSSNPCQNGGTCVRIYDGYQCICPSNWEGSNCASDVNECANFLGTDQGCQNGGTCTNLPGSYRCTCTKGWYGIHCTTSSTTCNAGNSHELCDHGTCVASGTVLGYTCMCDQGWKTDGVNPACSVDVNECEANHPPCSIQPPVPCINVPGTFYCGSCPSGFTGNGYYCADLDECLVDNGGCSKIPKVQCINTMGSRLCGACPAGYQGNGETCVFVGTCRINNGGCHPLATCLENPGYTNLFVECRCPTGYHGTGIGPHGCQPGSQTFVEEGPCASNPCAHGSCISHQQSFICTCNAGYTGPTCAIPLTPCSPNPCKNSGVCTAAGSGSVSCECTASFTGARCEIPKEACGGIIKDPSGTLSYPANGLSYQHGLSCAFIITTNFTQVLNVTFTRFDLESTAGCRHDFLQIHDGGNAGSHQLGRFCGKKLPLGGNIITTHHSLYLWFHTDNSVSRSGFALHWNSIKPRCGDLLQTEYGTISSPGSPGRYPPNRDCIWTIVVGPGKRIQFHFFTFMLEEHPTCNMDYLEINETISNRNTRLGLYCNHTQPPPVLTSGSIASLHFHSDDHGQDQGFQLTYSAVEGTPGCGGVFTQDRGIIVFPPHANKYETNVYCEWKIQLPMEERIRITWILFDLEPSENCRFDYVAVFDGPELYSPLIGRFCGKDLPMTIDSQTNTLRIAFKSDWNLENEGFSLKYETICGGEFRDPEGDLKSPYYPSIYAASRTCIYIIIQPPGKGIALTFIDVDIEMSIGADCYFDNIKVYDGDNENSTLLNTICGVQKPPVIYSSHNYLYLKFETDSSVHGKGFHAHYTTIDRRCGGLLKETNGIIESPKDSSKYSNNENCTWTIIAPEGFVIQLSFLTFHLEHRDKCQNDFVRVSENYDGEIEEIGRYCGTKKPPMLTSQSNIMNVEFQTDSSITFLGFTANYIFIDASKVCGGHYFTTTGVIKSPNYPDLYPPNRECTWVIETDNKLQIILYVEDFELEEFSDCSFDYLEIRNGGYETSPLIKKFCGTEIPSMIRSLTNQIFLKFVSDSSKPKKGFKIFWDSSTFGCGGSLHGVTGDIISPNYPLPYSKLSDCTYNIAVAAGNQVQIYFVDFDLEDQIRCRFDYLEISESIHGRSKNPVKYCGTTHPMSLTLNSNFVIIRFHSDYTNLGRGFHIKYATVCNNKLHGFSGVIESPNYPEKYPPSLNCSWVINAPRGNKINISFSHFEIESSSSSNDCKYDYLLISEGENDKANTDIGKYCTEKPPKISSTQNQIFIKFVTDEYHGFGGFRLEWSVDGCGGYLNRPQGELTSPGYPNSYPHDIECEWLIEVDYGNSIEILFSDVNTEKATSCYYDKIELFGGEDATAPKLAEFCHSKKPINFTSTSNKMFIKFSTDFSFADRGFAATYKSVPLLCGGRFQADHGFIQSANYPKNYPNNQNCEWVIFVEKNHIVNLTFIDFDVEDTFNCTDDYVKVFNGETRDDELLGTFCKSQLPPSVLSTGNKMLIVMRTDSLINAKGFRAEFTIGCGARIITDSSGIISSSSDFYLYNGVEINCTWTIIASDLADHITFHITHIDSAEDWDDTCENHFLSIYDGESSNVPARGTWCKNKAPPPIISNGNALTVHLYSLYGSTTAFEATYSVLNSACGGNYTSESGTIVSPSYPDTYPLNAECVWVLGNTPGNRIEVVFSSFDIEESDNCNKDYLEIRENSGIGKLIGSYCGQTYFTIKSDHKLWIKFRSDETGTGKGFTAEYTLLYGNEITGTSGEIASPHYPHPFKPSTEVTWRITVDFGKAVQIQFDDFHIETFGDCYFSNFVAYDGYDAEAPILKELCGSTNPESFHSSSNVMFIKFTGSYLRSGNWFYLHWYEVSRETSTAQPDINLSDCSKEIVVDRFYNSSKYIVSPGDLKGYDPNLDCYWFITSPPGTHVVIQFINIDLEESSECILDYVALYSDFHQQSSLSDGNLIKTLCLSNETHLSIPSPKNIMTVKFHSDSTRNGTGFKAYFDAVCGGVLEGSDGVIEFNETSKNHLYGIWSDSCEWNITVRPGRTIQVQIVNITADLNDEHCVHNYIILRNGITPFSPILGKGKYCGHEPSELLNTTSNQLSVKAFGEMIFYKIIYTEVGADCGGTYHMTIDGSQLDIKTPNYPNIPSPYTECFWTFIAPATEKISIHFVERFDLTTSPDCTREYVEIRDGGTDSSRLLGRYCSDTAPSSITSTGNVLYVHFYTDVTDPKNGFKAVVATQSEICGGIIRGNKGVITSPNYPEMFPNNKECGWWIIGPEDHTLKIEFQDFHFPSLRICNKTDHITIMEKVSNNDTSDMNQLGVYCGLQKPDIIETSYNEAVIILSSDHKRYLNYRGFKANFSASMEACGGTLTTMSGIIKSVGYPNLSSRSRYCTWRITVPEGHQIRLEIEDIDFDDSSSIWRSPAPMYLHFYNDLKYRSLIGLFKNGETNRVFISTSRYMAVTMWIKEGNRGFKASYSSISSSDCGGKINHREGSISVPSIRPYNESSYFCEWSIVPPDDLKLVDQQDTSITLTVSIKGLIGRYYYQTKSCLYLRKFISLSDTRENIGVICGNVTQEPYIIRSPSPQNILQVMNGTFRASMTFELNYSWQKCGGILTGPYHIISVPRNIDNPKSCAWRVEYPDSGEVIKMNFNRLNLGSCDKGYILVRNGGPMSPEMGKFCGNIKPDNITSSSHKLWIEYYGTQATDDFEFTLTSSSGSCGGVARGSRREIFSPDFPKQYPNNAECVWKIVGDPGFQIGLVFVDRFNIETSLNCANDFVEIFDWDTDYDKNDNDESQWKSIGKYCGRNSPGPFNVTKNKMKVVFQSNSAIRGDGFHAVWSLNCGGIFEAEKYPQYIVSPNYPSPYSRNLFCNYTIIAPKGKNIILEFEEFKIEKGIGCNFDNISIYTTAYDSYQSTPIVYCGNEKPPIQISESPISIIFQTDPYVQQQGFQFSFRITDCGGEIFTEQILSPPVSKNSLEYFGRLNCTWVIHAPSDKSITLRFELFELEYTSKCYFDSVTIYEGTWVNSSATIARLCGNITNSLPVIKSVGNSMTMSFYSDDSRHYRGFSAAVLFTKSIASGCGGSINLTNSLSWRSQKESKYDSYEDCLWKIEATMGKNIRMTFRTMDVKNTPNKTYSLSTAPCNGDFIEIRDGKGPFAELIGRYCGNNIPGPIESSMNDLWIRFFSDGEFQGNGVTATIEPFESPCGDSHIMIFNETKTLTSPGYPENYPLGIKCKWMIKAMQKSIYELHTIHIFINNLKMENSKDCLDDYIEIADKRNDHFISEDFGQNFIFNGLATIPRFMRFNRYHNMFKPTKSYKFCSEINAFNYFSDSDEVTIKLKSSAENPDKPRKFKLDLEIASCNRNYTSIQGRIKHRGFNDCWMTINVPDNYTISLYFNSMNIYDQEDCTRSYLSIYDGNFKSPLLATLCGLQLPSPIFSSTNQLSLHSVSQRSATWEFYDILYTSTDQGQGCGGQIFNYNGRFTSPMYPNNYRNTSTCVWDVSVPRGSKISLKFLVFDLGSSDCYSNYIQIQDQDTNRARILRYCASDNPADFTGYTHEVTITYTTSVNNGGSGWEIQFWATDHTQPELD